MVPVCDPGASTPLNSPNVSTKTIESTPIASSLALAHVPPVWTVPDSALKVERNGTVPEYGAWEPPGSASAGSSAE